MYRRKFLIFMAIVLAAAFLLWGVDKGNAQSLQSGKNTNYERHREDLQRLQEAAKALGYPEVMPQMPTGKTTPPYPPSIVGPAVAFNPLYPPGIGFNPAVDYTLSNFSQSPNIRKFINALPGLGLPNCVLGNLADPNTCHENENGQYIPIAAPVAGFYTDADYYELGVAQYSRKLHTDLPPTTLRGYFVKGDPRTDPTLLTPGTPQYLGPAIIARTYRPDKPIGVSGLTTFPLASPVNGRPVRLRFENHLPTSLGGADTLFVPVDPTLMGAGMGPMDLTGAPCDYGTGAACASFTQNRIAVHLHGGHTPGISDGTPHQWWTPANDPIPGNATPGFPWGMRKGPAFQNVPDMVNGSVVNGVAVPCIGGAKCFSPSGSDGIGTLYYTNQQSPRLLFFHDHAWGITRLNVYGGMAAPYLIVDEVEDDLIDGTNVSGVFTGTAYTGTKILPSLGGVYRYGIPLVIQDKSFVNDAATDTIRNAYPAVPRQFPANYHPTPHTSAVDPNWFLPGYGTNAGGGNLWMPHEYMPIENIFDPSGSTPNGRWDYGPFLIPPALPKFLTLPSPTTVPEAMQDTAVVNGTPFPYVNLPPDAIRFRILAAGNDRSWNLQLYSAAVGPALVTFPGATCTTLPIATTQVRGGIVSGFSILNPGTGCTAIPAVTITDVAGHAPTTVANATATIANGMLTGITLVAPNFGGAGYLAGTICKGQPASPPGVVGYTWADLCTEVSMVPAAVNAAYPTWPQDGRDGGVPDPTTQGPPWLQIGNEAGFLAQLAVWPQQPIDYEQNRQNIPFGGVTSRTLLLMGAMRADVITDFGSAGYAAGDILIIYNDGPAPMPMYWTLNDYYTDDPDQTGTGGAVPTPAGFGPNTRTLMQVRITGSHTAGTPTYAVTATPGFDRHSAIGSFLPPNISAPSAGFTALQTMLPKAFAATQEKPIVPQLAYNAAFPGFATSDIYVQGYMDTLNITGKGQSVARIVTTLPGAGYTVAPTVTILPGAGGCTTVPTATAGINPIGAVSLVLAGSGYTSAPTVTLGAPLAGGVRATAVATITGGVVTAITIVEPGSNYDVAAAAVAPTCTMSAPQQAGGVTATCTVAVATAGLVGSITVTSPGAGCINEPLALIVAAPGTIGQGATASVLLKGALAFTGKNLTEGFDTDFARVNVKLGSTPNPLTPAVGTGPVIGIAQYIDPPTEYLNNGETVLWRVTHLGVDSHSMHFHLFDLQVVNRIDYTNVVKPPYFDELGWRETMRTNPFEDIIIALKPSQVVLPFPEPHNIRPLDPTTPVGSTTNFLPVLAPVGVPAVAQTVNTLTDFGFEYVWHCHILGHEENDMMRPTVFGIAPVPTASAPSVAWNPTLGKYHVAIRNADSTMSIGTANVDGVLNFDFVKLPSGKTPSRPAITWDPLHKKLIIANQGNAVATSTNIYVASMNADGSGFSVWSGPFGVGTNAAPAIAWNPNTNQLQYAIKNTTNTIWLGTLNFNGTSFTSPAQNQVSTTVVASAPAIAIATTGPSAGKVQLAVAGGGATNYILVGNANPDGTGFVGWNNFPTGTTAVGVGIAWNPTTNKLDVVQKGRTNTNVYKGSVNGDSTTGFVGFTAASQVAGALSTDVPAAGVDPALTPIAPLNIFTINAGNISGYSTPGL